MIDSDAFIKRLELIFEYYGLSASSFADTINVQRSSISHLLSARNKPSLDFILKVMEHFPEVELLWLLNGKGNFPKKEASKTESITPITNVISTSDLFSENLEKVFESNEPLHSTENPKNQTFDEVKDLNLPFLHSSEIEQIVVFYKDGSFKSYKEKNPNLK